MSRHIYLSLGDSISRGYSVTTPERAYVRLVADVLQAQALVDQTVVIAGNGWTAQNLLRVLKTVDSNIWKQTQVITLMIGGNDLRRRYYSVLADPAPLRGMKRAFDEFSLTFRQISDLISAWEVPQVFVQTLYNPLPKSGLATTAIQRVNRIITTEGMRHGFTVVDVYPLFAGRETDYIHQFRTGKILDLSTPFCRPIHPNDSGHLAIANLILDHLSGAADQKNG